MKAIISVLLMLTSAIGLFALIGFMEQSQGALWGPAGGAILCILFLGLSLSNLGVFSLEPRDYLPYETVPVHRHH